MADERLTEFIERLRRVLGENLWGAVLFGSRARGDADASSDYDIFIIADSLPQRPIERQEFIVRRVRGTHGLSIIAKTRHEFESAFPSLYLDIAQDGRVLYDQAGYTAARLAQIKKLTEEAGLRRKKTGYGFNWAWKSRPGRKWRIDWTGVYGIV